MNHLVRPRFQGVNRLFVLAFEDDAEKTSNLNVMIDSKNFFDQVEETLRNNKIKSIEKDRVRTTRIDRVRTVRTTRTFFFLEKWKETVLDFSQITKKVL